MSGSRARLTRQTRAVATASTITAAVPAACLNIPDELAYYRQLTHDAVIELSGRRRRSGVTWRTWTGRQECRDAFEQLTDALFDETNDENAAQFLEFFDTYPDTCALVLATVDAAPLPSQMVGPS